MYNFCIKLFKLGIHIAAPFNKKAAMMVEGHRNLLDHIELRLSEIRKEKKSSKTYLVHCASLGEFEQGKPIIEAIRGREPEAIIIVTFFSPSGYNSRKNYNIADGVFYLPFDTESEAARFADIINPDISIIVKYEYWRNILKALKEKGSKIYIISSLFQEDMEFFRWYGKFFRSPLKYVTHFFVQDENSKKLLCQMGYDNVSVSGDTRFDRVIEITKGESSERIDLLEKFIQKGRKIFVAGSVWESDMKRLIPFIKKHAKDDIQFVIAPHNINESQINRWITSIGDCGKCVKFTEIQKGDFDIIFINCVGMLSKAYKFADLTFIGGGYDKLGIHNTLEPAVWYKPIIFGPVYSRYIEAVGLVECGGAFVVNSTEEIEQYWTVFQKEGEKHAKAAGDFVFRNSGVTDRIINAI